MKALQRLYLILTLIGVTMYPITIYLTCKTLTNQSLLVRLTSLLTIPPITLALLILIKLLVDTIRFPDYWEEDS